VAEQPAVTASAQSAATDQGDLDEVVAMDVDVLAADVQLLHQLAVDAQLLHRLAVDVALLLPAAARLA